MVSLINSTKHGRKKKILILYILFQKYNTTKWYLSNEHKAALILKISVIHHSKYKEKPHNPFNRWRKSTQRNSKTLHNRIQRKFLNLIGHLQKTSAIIIINSVWLFPPYNKKQGKLFLTTPVQHCTGILKQCDKTRKEIKSIQIGKEHKTVFIHRWHHCLCRKSQRIYNE